MRVLLRLKSIDRHQLGPFDAVLAVEDVTDQLYRLWEDEFMTVPAVVVDAPRGAGATWILQRRFPDGVLDGLPVGACEIQGGDPSQPLVVVDGGAAVRVRLSGVMPRRAMTARA